MLRAAMTCLVTCVLSLASLQAAEKEDGWVSLFDGKSMKGWKANENKETWKFEKGNLVCEGPRSHLFYVGSDKPFVNFEFKAEVMTTPGSNAGIYFHTRYQKDGWPKYGYEAQVNITHGDPKKTGSLYGVVNVSNPPAKDNEWWTQHIIVKGKHIQIKINDKTVVDYTEPENKKATSNQFERRLASGTFALQGHDPKSKVYFRNIQVKRLP
ncbi:MAG: DUF1080 domain-containing protein [Planctomycetaceae bacterium]|nr:DUF1080 domain-containing protein [Planctomycetaceae bacterium]|tara:strand:+ start:84 stop:716 length:633 start_codon:yes stop_codon:yes gene_type:complete